MDLCFYFIICFLWNMYLYTVFLWCIEKSNFKQKLSTRVNQKKIKSSWNEYVLWTCFTFNQSETFSENYMPKWVWLWLVYKTTKINCCLWLLTEFIPTQKRYPNSLVKISILTWKLFVTSCRTFKLLKNLFLAKHLISVAHTIKYIRTLLLLKFWKILQKDAVKAIPDNKTLNHYFGNIMSWLTETFMNYLIHDT